MMQTTETIINSSMFFSSDNTGTVPVPIYALVSLNVIVLVLSLPINAYVIRLITVSSGSGAASEFFALNLYVFEILTSFNAVPAIFHLLIYKNDAKSPLYYIVAFLSSLLGIGRPFFQCCVCLERYVAVIHPVIFLKYKPLRYRMSFSLVAWITVLGISVICPLITVRIVFYYVMLPLYLLLFSIKVSCSVAVLKTLTQPRPGEKCNVKDANANQMKKKASYVIVIILMSMVMTYCPLMMFIFLYDSLSDSQKWDGMMMYSYLLMLAGLVQPFLYLHRAGKLPLIRGLRCYNY